MFAMFGRQNSTVLIYLPGKKKGNKKTRACFPLIFLHWSTMLH